MHGLVALETCLPLLVEYLLFRVEFIEDATLALNSKGLVMPKQMAANATHGYEALNEEASRTEDGIPSGGRPHWSRIVLDAILRRIHQAEYLAWVEAFFTEQRQELLRTAQSRMKAADQFSAEDVVQDLHMRFKERACPPAPNHLALEKFWPERRTRQGYWQAYVLKSVSREPSSERKAKRSKTLPGSAPLHLANNVAARPDSPSFDEEQLSESIETLVEESDAITARLFELIVRDESSIREAAHTIGLTEHSAGRKWKRFRERVARLLKQDHPERVDQPLRARFPRVFPSDCNPVEGSDSIGNQETESESEQSP